MLEIFNNLFMSIAEQMGARLESTAQSVNIKERLDFSCALFDPDGEPGRQRPAHPRAPRLDGHQRQGGDRRRGRDDEPRRLPTRSTTRITVAPTCLMSQ